MWGRPPAGHGTGAAPSPPPLDWSPPPALTDGKIVVIVFFRFRTFAAAASLRLFLVAAGDGWRSGARRGGLQRPQRREQHRPGREDAAAAPERTRVRSCMHRRAGASGRAPPCCRPDHCPRIGGGSRTCVSRRPLMHSGARLPLPDAPCPHQNTAGGRRFESLWLSPGKKPSTIRGYTRS